MSKDTRVRIHLGLVGLLAAVSLFVACSSSKTTQPSNEFPAPSNLQVTNLSNEVDLTWDGSTGATGYNVYRSSIRDLATVSVDSLDAYRLRRGADFTVDASQTQYIDDADTPEGNPQNGTKYYYMVRAVKGSSSNVLSDGVEIDTAPRPETPSESPVSVYELRYTGKPSALNLASFKALSMFFSKVDSIDVYLGTASANDTASAALAFKSPSKVQSENDWSSRTAGLIDLGSGDAAWYGTWYEPDNAHWVDEVVLPTDNSIVDKVIAVKTPADAGGHHHYAKIRVQSYVLHSGGRELSLILAYQEIADYARFARSH